MNVRVRFRAVPRAAILTGVLTGFCFLPCFTSAAFAVDGVVLIDQTRALAGNVTPGDAPGFPVTLSLPGSYRLSGNLTVPAQTDGILIQNSDITIDLNGFRVTGAVSQEERPAGITDNDVVYRAINIRNGAMTNLGIVMASHQVDVRDVRISQAHFAIYLKGNTAAARGNSVFGGFTGIRLDGVDGIITDNVVTESGNGIVSFSAAALVRGNSSSYNQYFGIRVACPSIVVENIARHNTQADINIGPPSTAHECTLANNNGRP